MSWTLARTNAADERTLLEWAIKSATLDADNIGGETLELGFGLLDLLASLPFDDDETLLVSRDGAAFFRGRSMGERRGAFGSAEGATLKLEGPWWYLDNLIFQRQTGFVLDPTSNPTPGNPDGLQIGDFETVPYFSSIVTLGLDAHGARLDTAAQITEILEFAIDHDAPIAIGTIEPALSGPRDEVQDLSCGALILRLLKFSPGHTILWDHSVNPPAISIVARASRDPIDIDIEDRALRQIQLNPRRDLKITGVTINYLRIHTRVGFQFFSLQKEVAGPDPEGIGAIVLTLGVNGSYVIEGDTVYPQEAAPIGIADAIYEEFSIVPFEGSVVLVDQVIPPWLGRRLNIAGGLPAWAAARIPIQAIRLDLFPLTDSDGEWFRTELRIAPATQFKPGLRSVGLNTISPGFTGPPADPNIPVIPPIPHVFPPHTPPHPPEPPHEDHPPSDYADSRITNTGAYNTPNTFPCDGSFPACPAFMAPLPYGPLPTLDSVAVGGTSFFADLSLGKQRLFGPGPHPGTDLNCSEIVLGSGSSSTWNFDLRLLSANVTRAELIGTKMLSGRPDQEVRLGLAIGVEQTITVNGEVGDESYASGSNSWTKQGRVEYTILRFYLRAGVP